MGPRVIDNYTKAVLTLIALALVTLVLRPLVGIPPVQATLADLGKDAPGLTGEKVTVINPARLGPVRPSV